VPLLDGNHCGEDLLFALHNQHVGLQDALDRGSDVAARKAIAPLEHPGELRDGDDASTDSMSSVATGDCTGSSWTT
jgi:hypothetical protein